MGNCPKSRISFNNKKMIQMQTASEVTLNNENQKLIVSSLTFPVSNKSTGKIYSGSGDFDKICENLCNAMNIALKEFVLDDTIIENNKLIKSPQQKYKSINKSRKNKNRYSQEKKNEKYIYNYGTFDDVNKIKKCKYTAIIVKNPNEKGHKNHKSPKNHKSHHHHHHKEKKNNNLNELSINLNISNYSSEILNY